MTRVDIVIAAPTPLELIYINIYFPSVPTNKLYCFSLFQVINFVSEQRERERERKRERERERARERNENKHENQMSWKESIKYIKVYLVKSALELYLEEVRRKEREDVLTLRRRILPDLICWRQLLLMIHFPGHGYEDQKRLEPSSQTQTKN